MISGIGPTVVAPVVGGAERNRTSDSVNAPDAPEEEKAPGSAFTPSEISEIQAEIEQETPTAASNLAESSPFDSELTPEEEQEVQKLKKIDAEVRAHEQAHKSAGGPITGAIQYEFVTGPDGRQYAVGGEVDIDASPVSDNPEATIRKMDLVIRAALAPANPSPQDFAVAQQAQQTRLQAQRELREQQQAEREEQNADSDNPLKSPLTEDPNDPNAETLVATRNLLQASQLANREVFSLFSTSA